jgi:hypothetical protein
MPAPLPAELSDLLARLQAAGGAPLILGAEEVGAWPASLADALLAQGAIEPVAPAASTICPGCEEACLMPVNVRQRDGAEAVAFIVCDKRDDMGRVPVPLPFLARWQVTLRTLARALARSLGQDDATPLAQGWRLGWSDGALGRAAVTLQQQGIAVGGHLLELDALLTWEGVRLGLDGRALKRHADAPAAGGMAEESPEERAQRLRARKAELVNAGNGRFLKVIATEERISVSRVKQILGPPRSAPKAGPFDGLGARSTKRTPVSPTRRR